MPTLETTSRNAACNAVVDQVDVGTTNATGKLVLRDATTVISTHLFTNPAFGDASVGVATAAAIGSAAAVAAGVIDNYQVLDRDENLLWSGSARASGDTDLGEECVLDNTNVTIGQNITVSSFTHTAPA